QVAADALADRAAVAAELPTEADVILANELLDNLPVRVVEWSQGAWRELYAPESTRPTELSLDLEVPEGQRLPILHAARDWVVDASARAPRVVAFDYGARSTAELVGRTWLRTYAAHVRGDDPFVEPGSVDITVDIAIDQLPSPSTVSTQRDFLERWGIGDLVAE